MGSNQHLEFDEVLSADGFSLVQQADSAVDERPSDVVDLGDDVDEGTGCHMSFLSMFRGWAL